MTTFVWAARSLRRSPRFAFIYTAAAAVLLLAAGLACALPARRALRVPPMAAMRAE